MMLHVKVAPRRCGVVLGAVVLAGSLLAASRDAHACGATPTEVQALLPLEGATDVPLNAVLISSSNVTEAVFELRELDDSDAGARALAPALDGGVNPASDAGVPGAVPLDVDCGARGQGGGAVCLARPLQALKPNTRYAWRVAIPEGNVPTSAEGPPRGFTTGSTLDGEPIAADAVGLSVMQEHQIQSSDSNDCGVNHRLDVAYTPYPPSEPMVLHFSEYTPSYVMHATVLMGGLEHTLATATLYSPPACLAPVVYDMAGHRTVLPEWCPTTERPAQPPFEDQGDDVLYAPNSNTGASSSDSSSGSSSPNVPNAAAPRARSGCSLSMPSTSTPRALPTAAGLGLALLLAGRRRRRL